MGAARYRWFHEHGCCECIGSTCFDYGNRAPRCLRCPLSIEDEEDEDDYYDVHEAEKYVDDADVDDDVDNNHEYSQYTTSNP